MQSSWSRPRTGRPWVWRQPERECGCADDRRHLAASPSLAAWARTYERAICADSCMTSPSWPVMVRPGSPGAALASTKRTSPPTPGHRQTGCHAWDRRAFGHFGLVARATQPSANVGLVDSQRRLGAAGRHLGRGLSQQAGQFPFEAHALLPPGCNRSQRPAGRRRSRPPHLRADPARAHCRGSRWSRAIATFSSSV